MIWWLIIVVALAVIYYRATCNFNFFEKHGIPYAKPIVLLGSIWQWFFQRIPFAEVSQNIYNSDRQSKYIGFFEFNSPVLMIRDVDLIKSITTKNFDHFQNHRTTFHPDLDTLFSKNLFSLSDGRWKEVRKTLIPIFASCTMKSLFVSMRDCAEEYGDYFASLPGDQSTFELKDVFTKYVNDVIASCVYGIDINSVRNPNNTFYVHGREVTSFGRMQLFKYFAVAKFPRLCRLLGVRIFEQKTVDFFQQLIVSAIEARNENDTSVRPNMLQLLIDRNAELDPDKQLTIDEITAQTFGFFFGGYESASNLMSFAAYEVAVNDEIQRRLQLEIDQVLEDCDGQVTYEAINGMKYLDAVILETLRMYPAAVGTDRVCTKPFELPPRVPGEKPYVVQPGDCLWIPIYSILRDPQYYPDPNQFIPERFYNSKRSFLSTLSFGLGPRTCIASRFALLETKVMIFFTFANCELAPCAKSSIPLKLNKTGFSTTSENGFWLNVRPRSVNKNGAREMADFE